MNNKETIEQVLTYPIREISDWKITKETCQHFGVRVALSEKDGRTIEAVYFPYYDQNNKLCGYKKKDLTLPKDHDFHFTHIGSVKATGQLFGQNVAPSGGKKSFTHEGEKDVLASWQMLSNKFTSANPAVVGIPGTKWAARQIAANKRFYEQFKENVIVFDNDSCTEEELRKGDKKGKEATQDVAMLMPNILVTSFSEKDAHDMLMEGKEEEFYWAVIKPKKYIPQSIVQGGVGLERLKKPLSVGVYSKTFPKTMEKLRGFREGEMTIILSPPGVGKTTICKAIGYDLNVAEQTLFHIFVEEDIEKTQQSYIALDNNVFLPQLRVNPNILSDEQWEKSYNKLIDNGRTLWMDHFGSINPDLLMSDIRWAASNGFKFIILDHISMIFSGLETLNERKEIDILLTELAAFTKGAHVHPIVVSHIKRTQKNPPKNKDGSIKYPYWDTVASDAARGSGAFEQLAWNIIALEPEILENGERGRVRTRVWKNREWNTLGVGDILTMDKTTGRMINAADIMDF